MYQNITISPELLAAITKGEMNETDLENIVMDIDDINQHHDDDLVFIIGTKNDVVELFGCPSEEGLIALSVYYQTFLYTTPSTIFNGTICNPKELPYEIDRDEQVLVLFSNIQCRMFYGIDKATQYIEKCIQESSMNSIDDFAVIVGNELEFDVQEWNNEALGGSEHNGWAY